MTDRTWRHTGAVAGQSAPQLLNPPQRSAISFRLGTAPQFFAEMRRRLEEARALQRDGTVLTPFAGLARDPRNDWISSLLLSWAGVGDVLSFYQERLINEGFLRTAKEPVSLELMLTGLGIRRGSGAMPTDVSGSAEATVALDPGCSATADLLLRFGDTKGAPTRIVLAAGSAVRVASLTGGSPVFMETDRTVTLRQEWDGMLAYRFVAAPQATLDLSAPGILLQGAATGLKAGELVLLTGTAAGGEAVSLTRIAASVLPLRKRKVTEVTWAPPPSGAPAPCLVQAPRLFRFDRRLAIFGSDAALLSSLPRRQRLAQGVAAGGVARQTGPTGDPGKTILEPLNDGLPPANFVSILVLSNGGICLGTDQGIYLRGPSDRIWVAANSGMTQRAVTTLACGPGDTVLAGTAGGGVFRTKDPRRGWDSLAGGFVIDAGGKTPVPVKAALPSEVVRRLAYVENIPGGGGIVALTDSGLFLQRMTGSWLKVQFAAGQALPANAIDFLFDAAGDFVAICCEDGVRWLKVESAILPDPGQAETKDEAQQHSWLATLRGVLGKLADAFGALFQKIGQALGMAPPNAQLPAPVSADVVFKTHKPVALAALGAEPNEPELLVATSSGAWIFDRNGYVRDASQGLPMASDGKSAVALAGVESGLVGGKRLVFGVTAPDVKDAGIYQFDPATSRWTLLRGVAPAEGSVLLSLAADGALVSAQTPVPAVEWPDFALSATPNAPSAAAVELDLDSPSLALAPGSMAVLSDPEAGPALAGQVAQSSTAMAEGFDLNRRVCRAAIHFAEPARIAAFRRRQSTVYVDSAELMRAAVEETDWRPMGTEPVLSLAGLITDLAATAETIEASSQAAPAHLSSQMPSRQLRAQQRLKVDLKPSTAASMVPASRRLCVSGRSARVLPAMLGGVARLAEPWTARPVRSLPFRSVRALALLETTVIAGCEEGGIFRRAAETWVADKDPIPPQCGALAALAVSGTTLWAAGTQGVASQTADGAWTLAAALPGIAAGYAISALAADGAGTIFVGTASGLYLSADQGKSWSLQAGGALDPDAAITALAPLPDGRLLIGTDGDGLILFAPDKTGWTAFGGPIGSGRVSCIAVGRGRIIAGTPDAGAFVADAQAPVWQSSGLDPDIAVTAAASAESGDFIACGDGGLFRRASPDELWARLPAGLIGDICCVLAAGDDVLVAAAARLTTGAGDRAAALALDTKATLPAAALALLAAGVLGPEIRHALVQAGLKVDDDTVLGTFAGGWTLGAADGPPLLLVRDPLGILVLQPSAGPLPVAAARAEGGLLSLQAASDAGAPLSLQAYDDELLFLPSSVEDPSLTIVRDIQSTLHADDGGRTDVILDAALGVPLDPATILASANVVSVSQGRSVLNEILGDGNSEIARQQFRLRQPPLTFLPGPTPGSRSSTLTVAVDGVPWAEVPSFAGCGPRDQVYTVAIDSQGNAGVTFGDGIQGARLANGHGNVCASYRSGMEPVSDPGPAALQPAGAVVLSSLMSVSGGLSKSAKLVLRTPSVPAANIKSARLSLPGQTTLLRRLITPADYARLLMEVPGVGKVRVDSIALPGAQPSLFVTVAGEAASLADAAFLPNLRSIVCHSRAAGARPALLDLCEAVPVRLAVRVWLGPGLAMAGAEAALRAAILERFGLAGRSLAEPLVAADILAALQAHVGVRGVEILHLHRLNEPQSLAPRVSAQPARFADGALRPAQVVFVPDEANALLVSLVPFARSAGA